MSNKHSKTDILTYPIVINTDLSPLIITTLSFAKEVGNYYLRQLTNDTILQKLCKGGYAYKILEPLAVQKRYYIPNRINRGILEVVGRTLRAVYDRKSTFHLLAKKDLNPDNWDYKLLINQSDVYKKSQYIENLAEQTKNFISSHGSFPNDYYELAKKPQFKLGILSYAPDDGQAVKITTESDKLTLSLKVIGEENPTSPKDWKWISFSVDLPEVAKDKKLVSPDIRLASIGGNLLPILDLKVEGECKDKKESDNFLTVDWGVRKLITICVFNKDGEQISQPIFLKCHKITQKLLRIRKEIDSLKGKRDKLPKNSSNNFWYLSEIAKKWNKFRQIQKQLSHLASNVIVKIARIYNCSSIYVEWLASLKSRNLSKTLNWQINSTVRQQIYDKVQYKAKMQGISLQKPLSAAWTSQFCPKCGKKGYHVKASDRLSLKVKGGGWFYCPHCTYNADRDYVACQNLARKALFGKKLKDMSKAFVYKAKVISDKLFRQSISLSEKLRHHPNGWKNSVFLRPVVPYTGTLRL